MRLVLTIDVPSSAEPWLTHACLDWAATSGEGITITTPTGYTVDVDLKQVLMATEKPTFTLVEGVGDG